MTGVDFVSSPFQSLQATQAQLPKGTDDKCPSGEWTLRLSARATQAQLPKGTDDHQMRIATIINGIKGHSGPIAERH